jgi:hypothetical protein
VLPARPRTLRLAIVGSLVVVALISDGCLSSSWALQKAQWMTADVRNEASMTAGVGYTVTVQLGGVDRATNEATYAVTIRSREYPAFEQQTWAFRDLIPTGKVGGLIDWPLFRGLDQWDATRRIALFAYLADSGNPHVQYASLLSIPWPGAEWSNGTGFGDKLRAIGRAKGLGASDLAWVEVGDTDQLLGFDSSAKRWSLLADQTPAETGPLVTR